jgi:hypothetical protein
MVFKKNTAKAQGPVTGRGSNLNILNPKVFEMVQRRAYELYAKRGYTHGGDQNDWFEAERQVKREMGLSR